MANPLTDFVSPSELANRRQTFEIEGKISDFERLVEIVAAELEGAPAAERPRAWQATGVSIRLAFAWLDRQRGIPSVDGGFEMRLPAVCQRCLEAFELPLAAKFRIAFVAAATDVDDIADVDAWELADGRARLSDFVEEALVMALPLAPVHPDRSDCGPTAERSAEKERSGVRPFADLRSQLDNAK